VANLLAVDERNGKIYFTSAMQSPTEREVYAIGLDGAHLKCISQVKGSASANFAPDASVFIETFSDANTP
jgi:dipeptidyl-peptidase-4